MGSQAAMNNDSSPAPTADLIAVNSMAPQPLGSHFDWENTPREIRETIFQALDDDDTAPYWTFSRTSPCLLDSPYNIIEDHLPALLAAFRGLPLSYSQALSHFIRLNTPLKLRVGYCDFENWTRIELSLIQTVDLDATPTLDHMVTDQGLLPDFAQLPNLRHVALHMNSRSPFLPGGVDFATSFPLLLVACKNLCSVRVAIPPSADSLENLARRNMGCLVKQIEKKIGVTGTLIKTVTETHDVVWSGELVTFDVEHWEWIAEEGKGMDWSKGFGWKFNYAMAHHRRLKELRYEHYSCSEWSNDYLQFQEDKDGGGKFLLLCPPPCGDSR